MYEQMKKNSFRYIFTLMDSDEDGLISALKINILGL
jgi:Ca2+-binding EF-hand superfamily protein